MHRGDGRRGAPGVFDRAIGSGWYPGSKSGAPSQEVEEIASSVRSCSDQGCPQGGLEGLRLVRGGIPRGGGQAQGRRQKRGVHHRELSAPIAVRGGLSE